MELHTEHATGLDSRREQPAVVRPGDALRRHGRGVRMREVRKRSRRDPLEQDGRPVGFQRVPADVRHFDRAVEPAASSANQAESGHVLRLVAAVEEPLQPEADPQQRCAALHGIEDRRAPGRPESGGRAEMTDAGHDDTVCPGERRRLRGREHLGVRGGQSLAHRVQVAGAVVDEGDPAHNSPLVLGSIRAS